MNHEAKIKEIQEMAEGTDDYTTLLEVYTRELQRQVISQRQIIENFRARTVRTCLQELVRRIKKALLARWGF